MGVLNTVGQGLNLLFTPVMYGVVASLAIQLATWEKGDRSQDKFQDQAEPGKVFRDTFDFIVIGGGTSGSIVASRLSEYYSVLLLEAGGEPNPLVYVPGLASHLVNRPEVDWMHKTVAQRRACKLGQFKRASWAQGRGLGGSGNLDWMIGLRGSPQDFDNWGKLIGDQEWSFKEFVKYFQRHENFVGNTTDPASHASGGELTIQLPDYRPLAAEFVWAGKELGYPNLDLNGRFTEGFDELFYQNKRGEKQTTYRAFVEPIKRRENLTIRKYATVTKILLQKSDNSAYGVEYERHNKKYTVYFTREVVLSAGTVQSPKLLLLSGIGPKKHLEDVGVKARVNLPVGRNLQDHAAVYVGPFFINEPLTFNYDKDLSAKTFFEYGTYGSGPVTTTGYTATGLFASSYAKLRGEQKWADLQLIMHGVSVHQNYAIDMAHSFGLQETVLKKYYEHAKGRHSFHIVVSLGRPYARGEVRLASRNPTAPLIIDPKYLEDPWEFDVKTLVEGVKKAVELVETTKKFKNLGGKFTTESLPGCENSKFKSDAYWECYVRQFTVSLNNPVGTCTMGPKGSPHAVVDSKLRVVGVKNLRVIDASVMPSIVVSGTAQATAAIAEKGVEDILIEWKGKKSSNTEEILHSVPTAITTTTSSSPPPPTTTAKTFSGLGGNGGFNFNFLQGQSENKQTNHWQEAIDSIASFSRTIQQSLKVPPPSNLPPLNGFLSGTTPSIFTSSSTATSTPVKVTTTSKKPKVKVQNTLFHAEQQHQQQITPHRKPWGSSIGTTRAPQPKTKMVTIPLIPLPTQVSYNKVHVTTSTPSYPAPTTFRPSSHIDFINNTGAFSLHIPIIKEASFKPVIHHHSSPVKIYHASSNNNNNKKHNIKPQSTTHNIIQNIIRKEQASFEIQKPVFVVPSTYRTTSRPKTTTTQRPSPPPTPVLRVTTRRPVYEVIQRDILPMKTYDNLVEIPMTNVQYYVAESTTSQSTPSTSTTSLRTPSRIKSPQAMIIPAISLPNPLLETTTTRITGSSLHNQIQTIPQDIYLTGLESLKLVDVSTEIPRETIHSSTLTSSTSSSLASTSEETPIYYVVRKKNKNALSSTEGINAHLQAPAPVKLQHPHHHRLQRPRMRRPDKPLLRKTPRHPPPGRRNPQSTRNFPMETQLPQQRPNHLRNLHTFHSHLLQNEDQKLLGSSQIMQSVLQSPFRTDEELDGIITPAISSPLYHQNVLNQLVPIQKKK